MFIYICTRCKPQKLEEEGLSFFEKKEQKKKKKGEVEEKPLSCILRGDAPLPEKYSELLSTVLGSIQTAIHMC